MKMNPRFSTFNDGILWVCEPEDEQTDFNAVKNTRKASDLKKIEKLDFKEMSKREQDLDFAESQGRALNLKVRTRLREWVDKMHLVLIGKTLYSIINIDMDRMGRQMFIYLEEVRKFE